MAVALVKQATGNSPSSSTSLTCTFASATTAGNLLVLAMAGDKNTGSMTAAGWTQIINSPQASVSLYLYWRVSTGETSFTITWGTASTAGNTAWIGEYDDSAVPSGTWSVVGSAVQTYSDTNTTSKATGTTAALTAAGMGVAVAAVDSSQNVTTVGAWGNSYAARYSATGLVGRGAIFVAEKLESAGAAASSTFNYTGTADQIHAGIGVFSKASSAAEPSEGSASGTVSFAGSTAGKRTPKASAAGTAVWAGSAAGRRVPKASASGAVSFAGSAAGKRTPEASAAGTVAWAGSSSGARTPKASAAGGFTYTGSAAGATQPAGAADGAVTWTGSAAGSSVRSSSAAVDKFAGQNEALWAGWGPNVGVVDGHLRIIPTAWYPVLWSVAQYDLRGSHFHAELVETPAAGAGTIEALFVVELDNANRLEILWANNWLTFRSRVGGSSNDTGFAYSPTDHRWVRISEAAGVVSWSTSPDGVVWTERRSLAAPFDVSRIRLVIGSGWWGTETGDPGAFRVDNVNASPPNQGSAAGSVSWAGDAAGSAPSVAAHTGTAAGEVAWAGSAVGSRASTGAAAGTVSWAGSAVGSRVSSGTATGTAAWTGSAVGARTPEGAAAGTFTVAGAAVGRRHPQGSAAGTVVWVGSAAGSAVEGSIGAASGAVAWAGAAVGARQPKASAAGAYQYQGAAAGRASRFGAAAGTFTVAGSAVGRRVTRGTAAGGVEWAGSASGGVPVVGSLVTVTATLTGRTRSATVGSDPFTATVGARRYE